MCELLPREELDRVHSAAMAGLYLRGFQRPLEVSRRHWPRVLHTLRRTQCDLHSTPLALREDGFEPEAYVLESNLVDALRLLSGDRCITCVSEGYPIRLIERLGPAAPPALWWNGEPLPVEPSVTVVGSREIDRKVRHWLGALARNARELGYSLVSGGAPGCDRAAIAGAGRAHGIEVWPCGLFRGWTSFRGAVLAVAGPEEQFSKANAMERNALLYAMSQLAVVGAARLGEGGTWHGATGAIRRRLTRVAARDDGSPASCALMALGAIPIREPDDLARALTGPCDQSSLALDAPSYGARWDEISGEICEFKAKYAA